MRLAFLASTLCVASLTLVGCSSKLTQPDEYSGFLKDYSRLKEAESPSGAPVMRWVDPQLDINKYTAFYVEPSQLYPKPQPTEKIPQSTLQGITSYYDTALKRELGKSLPLATSPGPGTIVVRPAITGVSSKTKGLRPYEVIPIALVAAGVSAATGIRDQDTTIATEVAFIDAQTNKVIAQGVRKGAGQQLDNSSQVMQASDAKKVLDSWASDVHQYYLQMKAKAK
ncbi:hypothetical protein BLX42_00360 [Pseudomonas sp. SG-MS2]|uniref:DUF3313 domain-containing protein n=1 Tax=Pseudomonas putida TaxID=303 RepID=A0A7Y7ZD43_PSEPU|nr:MULTISPECIES: DUF3313 domain-containing protein [Pseudomonas]KAF1313050.1 hypothetical protein BLX42_00360 [Pseudomonas sp. SG-MS2]NWC81825.1 DUF3313 domain-containing protein [Pseudomonas putida]